LNTPADGNAAAAASTVADVGERGVIARIEARIPPAPAWMLVGVGDDAAVLQPPRGALEVLTTDGLVEGVHFDQRFSRPFDIGWKALAVNLSDVAAMGGTPRAALLSLALPPSLPLDAVDDLLDGLLALASEARVTLAGGNVTRSPGPLVVDVALTGSVRSRDVLRRGGAKPGDAVYVTGSVGAALAGLEFLRAGGNSESAGFDGSSMDACTERYRRPAPRYRIGTMLGRARAASACMDLSDGLADAARRIAHESRTGIRLNADALPLDPSARRWFEAHGRDAEAAASAGGDDYELLFTVPRKRTGRLRHVMQQARGIPITRIGDISPGRDAVLVRGGRTEPLPAGFVHF
jgi:thiamine-monophosphate kinase